MIPWADKVGGLADPGYKASTQAYWAAGAVLGSFLGGHIASLLGRRLTYFLISLGAVTITGGIFVFLQPLDPLSARCFRAGLFQPFLRLASALFAGAFSDARSRHGHRCKLQLWSLCLGRGVLAAGALMQLLVADTEKSARLQSRYAWA